MGGCALSSIFNISNDSDKQSPETKKRRRLPRGCTDQPNTKSDENEDDDDTSPCYGPYPSQQLEISSPSTSRSVESPAARTDLNKDTRISSTSDTRLNNQGEPSPQLSAPAHDKHIDFIIDSPPTANDSSSCLNRGRSDSEEPTAADQANSQPHNETPHLDDVRQVFEHIEANKYKLFYQGTTDVFGSDVMSGVDPMLIEGVFNHQQQPSAQEPETGGGGARTRVVSFVDEVLHDHAAGKFHIIDEQRKEEMESEDDLDETDSISTSGGELLGSIERTPPHSSARLKAALSSDNDDAELQLSDSNNNSHRFSSAVGDGEQQQQQPVLSNGVGGSGAQLTVTADGNSRIRAPSAPAAATSGLTQQSAAPSPYPLRIFPAGTTASVLSTVFFTTSGAEPVTSRHRVIETMGSEDADAAAAAAGLDAIPTMLHPSHMSRFKLVHVDARFQRGRWHCWDYKEKEEHPHKTDMIEFEAAKKEEVIAKSWHVAGTPRDFLVSSVTKIVLPSNNRTSSNPSSQGSTAKDGDGKKDGTGGGGGETHKSTAVGSAGKLIVTEVEGEVKFRLGSSDLVMPIVKLDDGSRMPSGDSVWQSGVVERARHDKVLVEPSSKPMTPTGKADGSAEVGPPPPAASPGPSAAAPSANAPSQPTPNASRFQVSNVSETTPTSPSQTVTLTTTTAGAHATADKPPLPNVSPGAGIAQKPTDLLLSPVVPAEPTEVGVPSTLPICVNTESGNMSESKSPVGTTTTPTTRSRASTAAGDRQTPTGDRMPVQPLPLTPTHKTSADSATDGNRPPSSSDNEETPSSRSRVTSILITTPMSDPDQQQQTAPHSTPVSQSSLSRQNVQATGLLSMVHNRPPATQQSGSPTTVVAAVSTTVAPPQMITSGAPGSGSMFSSSTVYSTASAVPSSVHQQLSNSNSASGVGPGGFASSHDRSWLVAQLLPGRMAPSHSPAVVATASEGGVVVLSSSREVDNAEPQSISPTGTAAGSFVAIDSKIEQAMDLVKTHLMYAVRDEVDQLRQRIVQLEKKASRLETENAYLREHVSADTLARIQASVSLSQTTSTSSTVQAPVAVQRQQSTEAAVQQQQPQPVVTGSNPAQLAVVSVALPTATDTLPATVTASAGGLTAATATSPAPPPLQPQPPLAVAEGSSIGASPTSLTSSHSMHVQNPPTTPTSPSGQSPMIASGLQVVATTSGSSDTKHNKPS